jgi:secreted trypsin-like serine protease
MIFILIVAAINFVDSKVKKGEEKTGKCMNHFPKSKCAHWKKKNYCEKGNAFRTFMKANCKLECDFCTPKEYCKDTDKRCPLWKSYCKQAQYKTYMTTNCQKTCGLCKFDGNWGTWSEFSKCQYKKARTAKKVAGLGMYVHGPGKQTRFRQCNDPKPKGDGKKCQGKKTTMRGGILAQEKTRPCGCELMCNSGKVENSRCNSWAQKGFCKDKRYKTYMEQHCGIQCRVCTKPKKQEGTQKKGEACGKGKGECVKGLACSQNICVTSEWDPNDGRCGQNKIIGGRVIGGNNTKKGEFPWQAGMWKAGYDGFDDEFYCGGTLVDWQFIVTAAHCVEDVWEEDIVVKFGDHDRTKTVEAEKRAKAACAGKESSEECKRAKTFRDRVATRSEVEKIIPHPEYNTETINNDIAIIKLLKPLKDTKYIQLACLPDSTEDAPVSKKGDNIDCYITGWGKTKGDDPSSTANILQKAKMPLISRKKCADMNNRNSPNKINGDTMLCAGQGPGSIVSGCQGDSGGPLVCIDTKSDDPKYTLTGAVSWGDRECNSKEKYTVFARISHYLPWIKKTMLENK